MIYDGDKEYFEADDADTIDNFDKMNEKYRNNVEWIVNIYLKMNNQKEHNSAEYTGEDIVKDDIDIIRAFKNIFSPTEFNINEVTTESEYISGETDPYQRIINIKQELLEVREKIDEEANKFKSNPLLNETQNYNKVLEELDQYKIKIDSFINYTVFNNTLATSANNRQSGNSHAGKEEYTSICEKYNRIAENLVSQIKLSQNDIINNNVSDLNINYEIVSNPEIIMENLTNRVNELEDMVSNLEQSIGNWNMVIFTLSYYFQYSHNESISITLTKLIYFIATKMTEKYDKKYQTFVECGKIISDFIEKKKEKIESGSYFLKIKELYSILEFCENFDKVFNYIKKRLVAIKEIHDNSDQFDNLLGNLNETVENNQKKFLNLLNQYEDTVKTFEEFQKILNEVKQLDDRMKTLMI